MENEQEQDWLESIGLTGNVEETEPPPDDQEPDSAEEAPAPKENKEDAPAPEPAKETPPPAEDPRIKELEEKTANLEKRLHDTQAALTRSRQQAKAKPAPKPEADEEAGWFDDEEEPEEQPSEQPEKQPETPPAAPDSELKATVDELKESQRRMEEREAVRRWDAAEAPVREKYPDYADVVDKSLIPAINANDERAQFLMAEFRKNGATPEAAYKVGQMLRQLNGEAPQPKNNNEHTAPESRIDAPDWNSTPPAGGEAEAAEDRSPLDEVLSELRR